MAMAEFEAAEVTAHQAFFLADYLGAGMYPSKLAITGSSKPTAPSSLTTTAKITNAIAHRIPTHVHGSFRRPGARSVTPEG